MQHSILALFHSVSDRYVLFRKEIVTWHPSLISVGFDSIIELMTLRVLEKEAMELPPRSRVRLAEKIIESLDDFADPTLEAEWNDEIERRVREIESGKEKGIPAEHVMKDARRAINKIRRVPSARRK